MAPLNQERWSDLSKVAQLEIVGRVQRVFSYPWLYWQEQTWFISGRAMTTGVQVTVAFAITAATGMFMEHLLCVKSHGTHFIWYDVIWFLSLNRAQDFLKIFYLFIFTEIGEGREKERERNIIVCLPLVRPLTGDLAYNPGTCCDWESEQQPFGSQAGTQSTEPHQPGPLDFSFN